MFKFRQKKSHTGNLFIILFLFLFSTVCLLGEKGNETSTQVKLKKEALLHLDQMSDTLNQTARQIWEYAETALKEHKSSQLLADFLKSHGFTVELNAGGMSTAFVATYGQGHPIIGILGEYDALPGLSQKPGVSIQEPLIANAPGHGCGHNLLGVAGAGAAVTIKKIMELHRLKGTIKFFGCPAEETVEGKTYMARDGVFNGLDICLDWHPSDENEISLDSSQALNNFEVIFRGKTAHAAGDPWNGRSALDAIELMNHGINCLREHVPTSVRLHFVILEGGRAPNVVPDYTRGWYYVRGKDRSEVEDVYARVLKIAEGASLMTETTHEIHIITGVYNYLKNKTLASVLHRNFLSVKAPSFTKEEQEFAQKLQRQWGKKERGLFAEIKPFVEPKELVSGGSTDVADVSWLVPTAALSVACFPLDAPGHHWGIVSCSGSSIGFKGMQVAARVLSTSAIDLLLDPSIIQNAQKEFKEKTKDFVYKSAIPENQKPPQHR